MKDNNGIVYSSSIWDLHIHTCQSKKSSGEFQKMGIEEYLDCIEKIFDKYESLNMISFTDHNAINYEVYEKYYKRKISKRVNLIPGVEIDVNINNAKEYKHIIVYFDPKGNNLKELSEKINGFIQENIKGDNASIEIGKLLDYLVGLKKQFILSPHCYKQGKRGINESWDEEKIKTEPHKYSDQFFCFWETSGKSDIARAEKLIQEFNLGKRVSIVSFSDSSDSKKLEEYLSNPPQYFNCLPNFRGLQLAGVDCRRITDKQYSIDKEAKAGNYIKKIKFDNNEIMLSPKLNVIIGGRGSGKSLLLDSLNLSIKNRDEVVLNDNRKKYLSKFTIKTYNGNLKEIKKNMQIDYFDQLYVSKIFDGNNNIKDYFRLEFDSIKKPALNDKILKDFERCIKYKRSDVEKINISSLVENFSISNFKEKLLNLDGLQEDKKQTIDYKNLNDEYEKIIYELPDAIRNNREIRQLFGSLLKKINDEVYKFNLVIIKNNMVSDFIKMCEEYESGKSKMERNKNDAKRKFRESFEQEKSDIVRKVRIVNSYINITLKSNSESFYNSECYEVLLLNGNKIKFEKSITREKPFDYFERISSDYLTGFKGIDSKFVQQFCYGKIKIKTRKNEDDYLEALEKFDLDIKNNASILFCKEGKKGFDDIENFSPGKKSNVLLEYILSKKTDVPLLIDQPEDNIDNTTIYNELATWVYNAKAKRQLIIVTHDANIAINADAENIIFAEEISNDDYSYRYGALEYEDNIDIAANILDGGIEAVQKRLKKYGSE